MMKKNYLKIFLVILFTIIAGVLYSCKTERKENLLSGIDEYSITQYNATTSESNSDTTSNDIQILDNTKTDELSASDMSQSTIQLNDDKLTKDNTTEYIYVHICGEVVKPDVYKVVKDTRVFEVIEAAGGLTDLAAGDYINQAGIVTDGQQIYIPSKEEVKNKTSDTLNQLINTTNVEKPVQSNSEFININTATLEELMTLSGIGQAKAQAIIDYRNSNGKFKSIEEIKNIDGIKDAIFNKIKDKIKV